MPRTCTWALEVAALVKDMGEKGTPVHGFMP